MTTAILSPTYSHAVSRSNELLSCARTALKISQQKEADNPDSPWHAMKPTQLHLYDPSMHASSSINVSEGLLLLRSMKQELQQLEQLVRRRGTTNDPTEHMSQAMARLEDSLKQLTAWLPTLLPLNVRTSSHYYKHCQKIQEWFRQQSSQLSERLQKILKVRSQVVAAQTQRRQQFRTSSKTSRTVAGSNGTADNPLFQVTPVKKTPVAKPSMPSTSSNGGAPAQPLSASAANNHAPYPPAPTASTYYGGGYNGGSGGYGSSTNGAGYGMRQRKTGMASGNSSTTSTAPALQQEQLYVQEHQTQRRLQEARHVEKTLADLGTMFGKMTNLISQQSEVVDKLEDDVECAMVDVDAGGREIQYTYEIKKGNRSLILKVFGLLIFLIIFLRLAYKR